MITALDIENAASVPVLFTDPEIRRRRRVPLQPATGGAKPIYSAAGGYAVTLRFEVPTGGDPIAVRVMFKQVPDLLDRYAAISQFLEHLNSPFFVEFSMTAPPKGGIFLNDSWHPVLRMGWAEGQYLDRAIDQNLRDRDWLQQMRDQLLEYARLSAQHGFSHGDLHPQNMLVDPIGQLRLVDYDSLFVPTLSGQPPGIAGQRDWQSPQRNQDFAYHLDHFSLVVLDLSLAALQREPSLRAASQATRGEGLLLGAKDYTAPAASVLLNQMARLPHMKAAVAEFRRLCVRPLPAIPTLVEFRSAVDVGFGSTGMSINAGPATTTRGRLKGGPRLTVAAWSFLCGVGLGSGATLLALDQSWQLMLGRSEQTLSETQPPVAVPPTVPISPSTSSAAQAPGPATSPLVHTAIGEKLTLLQQGRGDWAAGLDGVDFAASTMFAPELTQLTTRGVQHLDIVLAAVRESNASASRFSVTISAPIGGWSVDPVGQSAMQLASARAENLRRYLYNRGMTGESTSGVNLATSDRRVADWQGGAVQIRVWRQ